MKGKTDPFAGFSLSEDPVVRLLSRRIQGTEKKDDLQAVLNDPRVERIIGELLPWPGEPLNSHKSPQQSFQKLSFLADIGLTRDIPSLKPVIARILETTGDDGMPRLSMKIGESHGGTEKETNAWALCDAPVTLRALLAMGVPLSKLEKGVRTVASLMGDEKIGCHVSKELGNWRGPGKKTDPCPFATLSALKLFTEAGDAYKTEAETCADTILSLWTDSRTRKPYIFHMGTDFRKLKLPFVWYDILNVAFALSRVEPVRKTKQWKEMAKIISDKRGADGSFTPESVWQYFKDWDFGQKKKPSQWMAYVAETISLSA